MGRPCNCCGNSPDDYHTLIRVNTSGVIDLLLDFGAAVSQCDGDSVGNLYQVGSPTSGLINGNVTFGTVSSITDATHVVFENDGTSGNAASGTIFASGAVVVDAEIAEGNASTVAGTTSSTNTSAAFSQPSVSSTVTVSVADTSWMTPGQRIYINDAQTAPMITVKSWDSDGNLRWAWSECPYGMAGTGSFSGSRFGPQPELGCRNIPASTDIIVGDNWTSSRETSSQVHATKLDANGNVVWRTLLPEYYMLVGAGPTLSLWQTDTSSYANDWMLVSNVDGSIVYTKTSFPSGSGLTNQGYPYVQIDEEDRVYEVYNINGSGTQGWTQISRYSGAGSTTDWQVVTPYIEYNSYASGTGSYGLGGAYSIVVGSESIYLGCGGTFNNSCGYAEKLSRDDGSHESIIQLQSITQNSGQEYYVGKLLFADDSNNLLAWQPSGSSAGFWAEMRRTDGSRWKIWEGMQAFTKFVDARSLGSGGSLWSQPRNNYQNAPSPDFLTPPTVCSTQAIYNSVFQPALPGWVWDTPSGCGGNCEPLVATIPNQAAIHGGCAAATGPGQTLSLDCIPIPPTSITCTGTANFTSIANGAGGFQWSLASSTCSAGCSPIEPSTIPTALGQTTSTGCTS